jgi:hypothetical protein
MTRVYDSSSSRIPANGGKKAANNGNAYLDQAVATPQPSLIAPPPGVPVRALIIEKRVQNLNRLTTCSSDSRQPGAALSIVVNEQCSAARGCQSAAALHASRAWPTMIYPPDRNRNWSESF